MNQPENVTWRTYLGDLVRRMDATQKQKFYEGVGVTRTTVGRWRSGDDSPKAANLQRLLTVLLGEQRDQFLDLLQDDPRMWALLPGEVQNLLTPLPKGSIPSPIYAKILREGRNGPDRFWQLCETLLRYALAQLDPQRLGMEIVVARCMPPRTGGKVRSLHEDVAMGTSPWRGDLHHKEYFLGAESLAGYAVSSRHGEMVPDLQNERALVPFHPMEHERSAAAYPIIRENCIAGALIVSSTQVGHFIPDFLALIEAYADLVSLAFYDRDFYPASLIDLCLMPRWTTQQAYMVSFRSRVEETYRTALLSEKQDLAQVEQAVRTMLEGELIQIVGSSVEETVHT